MRMTCLVVCLKARKSLFTSLLVHVHHQLSFNTLNQSINVIVGVADLHPTVPIFISSLRSGVPNG